MRKAISCILISASAMLLGCNGSGGKVQGQMNQTSMTETLRTPAAFDADSAYQYIAQQVAFGTRVPGSVGHKACGDWIVHQLRSWGYTVTEQPVKGTDYYGKPVEGRNIIATRQPDASERLLLMAHWDTRPVADQDPNPSKRREPILGADDGGSGVAVLLELARQWRAQELNKGVDFVFFDLEDGGRSGDDDSWCQGAQHWAKHPHVEGYVARHGILLDMVGAKGARFYWEYHSQRYAAPLMRELWETARQLGWHQYFIPREGAGILDDHLPVIKYRDIPSVDIVNFSEDGQFGAHWHTHADNLDNISLETLRAVGETVATFVTTR